MASRSGREGKGADRDLGQFMVSIIACKEQRQERIEPLGKLTRDTLILDIYPFSFPQRWVGNIAQDNVLIRFCGHPQNTSISLSLFSRASLLLRSIILRESGYRCADDMRPEFHLLGLLLLIAACVAQDFPQTVELDLIFPRENETYAPIRLFPFVFGLQNAAAGLPFKLSMTWRLLRTHPPADAGTQDVRGFSIDVSNATSGPFLIIESTRFFNGNQVGPWVLTWDLTIAGNCSATGSSFDNRSSFEPKRISFSTALGGKLPDIFPGEGGTCPSQPTTFEIEKAVPRPYPDVGGSSQCPVLRTDSPPGDPCAFPVDEFVASNVTAVMKRIAFCTSSLEPSPNETWPQTVCTAGAWNGGPANFGRPSALLAFGTIMITAIWSWAV
jgi:hypothetical protein